MAGWCSHSTSVAAPTPLPAPSPPAHHHCKVLEEAVGPGRRCLWPAPALRRRLRLSVAPRPLPLLTDVFFGIEVGPLSTCLLTLQFANGRQVGGRTGESVGGWSRGSAATRRQRHSQPPQVPAPRHAQRTPLADSGPAAVCSSARALLINFPSPRALLLPLLPPLCELSRRLPLPSSPLNRPFSCMAPSLPGAAHPSVQPGCSCAL